jgi:hypothetical protein
LPSRTPKENPKGRVTQLLKGICWVTLALAPNLQFFLTKQYWGGHCLPELETLILSLVRSAHLKGFKNGVRHQDLSKTPEPPKDEILVAQATKVQ